jgi:hypothetical protein
MFPSNSDRANANPKATLIDIACYRSVIELGRQLVLSNEKSPREQVNQLAQHIGEHLAPAKHEELVIPATWMRTDHAYRDVAQVAAQTCNVLGGLECSREPYAVIYQLSLRFSVPRVRQRGSDPDASPFLFQDRFVAALIQQHYVMDQSPGRRQACCGAVLSSEAASTA